MRGACKIDANADNTIERLKGNQSSNTSRRQTMIKTTTVGGGAMVQSDLGIGSTGAAQTGHIYILERDTKFVYEYQLSTKNIYKRTV